MHVFGKQLNVFPVKEEVLKTGLVDEKTFDQVVNPKKMIGPQ